MPAEERIKNDPRFTFAKTPAEQSIFNTQSAEAQQQEQNDQKQKKQNDEWHWDEKDLTSYVDAKLEELFKQKVFFEEGGMWIKTQCATANGLGRESEAFLSRRKGQLFCTYNLDNTLTLIQKCSATVVEAVLAASSFVCPYRPHFFTRYVPIFNFQ